MMHAVSAVSLDLAARSSKRTYTWQAGHLRSSSCGEAGLVLHSQPTLLATENSAQSPYAALYKAPLSTCFSM